ncbi:MAG: hypothetical protein AB7N76_09150 [Planctomycetota bacterium]
MAVLLLLAICAASTVVGVIGMLLVGLAFGLRPTRVSLFAGTRSLYSRRIGGTTLRVGAFPWLSSLEYGQSPEAIALSPEDYPEDDLPHEELVRRYEEFVARPLPVQAAVPLGGPLLLLILAGVVLGPHRLGECLGRGFAQLVRGGVSPFAVGAPLMRGALELLRGVPLTGAAVVLAKLAAWSLLPLPGTAGGNALLLGLFGWRGAAARPYVQWIGTLVVLALALGWALALGRALLAG